MVLPVLLLDATTLADLNSHSHVWSAFSILWFVVGQQASGSVSILDSTIE